MGGLADVDVVDVVDVELELVFFFFHVGYVCRYRWLYDIMIWLSDLVDFFNMMDAWFYVKYV